MEICPRANSKTAGKGIALLHTLGTGVVVVIFNGENSELYHLRTEILSNSLFFQSVLAKLDRHTHKYDNDILKSHTVLQDSRNVNIHMTVSTTRLLNVTSRERKEKKTVSGVLHCLLLLKVPLLTQGTQTTEVEGSWRSFLDTAGGCYSQVVTYRHYMYALRSPESRPQRPQCPVVSQCQRRSVTASLRGHSGSKTHRGHRVKFQLGSKPLLLRL